MKQIKRALFFCVASLAMLQSVSAVTITADSGIGNVPQTDTTGTIERGGTITAINLDKAKIAVDGVTYPLTQSLRVYAANGMEASRHKLRVGVPVRFNTVKYIVDNRERVVAIWIATGSRRSPQE